MQNKQPGFSFLEIMIVLLLISIAGSFVIPTFFGKRHGVIRKQFIADFTTLVQETLFQAITTGKIHQLFFDIQNQEILVKVHEPSLHEDDMHQQFELAPADAFTPKMKLSQQLVIKNFYIQGIDEVKAGSIMNEIWFYIMPDGSSQTVIINIEDQDPDSLDFHPFSISINPFYSQVQEHDAFQKP